VSQTDAPWTGKKYAYAGWVPNVHSHLSFSLIGKFRGPEITARTAKYHPLGAFVCVVEKRQTDDFLVPALINHWLRPQATQHFILIGSTVAVQTPIGVIDLTVETPDTDPQQRRRWFRTFAPKKSRSGVERGAQRRVSVETALDAQGMLRGRILVVPWQSYTPPKELKDDPLRLAQWPKQAREYCKRHREWLKSFREELVSGKWSSHDPNSDSTTLNEKLGEFLQNTTTAAHQNSYGVVSVEFALFRTGEARLWFEDEVGDKLEPKHRREVSRQAYYFLKDTVHDHVHHDAKSDQITPLTETSGLTQEEGEEHWRRDTVWSLSRSVDALARRGMLQALREATGIIAYADAFQSTLMRYRRQANRPLEFEPNPVTYRYDFAHIRESLKVRVEQVTARRTLRAQMFVAFLAGSVAMTSLLVSAVSVHNGALQAKVAGTPILLGVTDQILGWLAYFYWSPTILLAISLTIFSWLWLSEDRISAARSPGRKLAQTVRGAANSIALRLGWGGLAVQRMLYVFYTALLIAMVGATIYAPRLVGGIAAPPPAIPLPPPHSAPKLNCMFCLQHGAPMPTPISGVDGQSAKGAGDLPRLHKDP
jgi:hypothetical protein